MIRTMAGLVLACSAVGCASIVNDSTHPMKLETLAADGKAIAGAECKLVNDYGSVTVRSGETSPVRRSNKDLDINCKHPDNPDAVARAISRANAGLAGNILLGGVIGAVIDHSKGTAYTYPTWIRLVFGKTLVFDRSNEKDGQPLDGSEAEPTKTATK